jgi:pyruvate/2-oxoglutarate dehydrogenase complex dihydrolipoamide acyltransferase (E2) component
VSDPKPTGWARAAVLAPALIVGAGAVAATAHGGYEVAAASGVPEGLIAALYPLITDGLALVAYASTHRLAGAARHYAWAVVILAAALSGLAQAVYLVTGPGLVAPPGIRFGVGAWPAVAGAVAAHLVFLLAQKRHPEESEAVTGAAADELAATHQQPPATPPPAAEAPIEESQPAAARPTLRSVPAKVSAPAVRATVDQDAEGKARELAAAGVGRTTIIRETGLKDHVAKEIVREAKARAATEAAQA